MSEVLAHAYVSGDAPSVALLAPSLVSVSLVGGPPRNDSSSGSRTRSLLFQCDLSPTWGYIRQRCSLCRCSLLCESIPKLAALQPPWPREQFGILRKLFEAHCPLIAEQAHWSRPMSASKHYNTLLSTIDLFTSMEVRNKGTGYLFFDDYDKLTGLSSWQASDYTACVWW